MVNGIYSSMTPYQGYPSNAIGANTTTKDIASYCYDTQRNDISETYGYLTSNDKPSYKWPVIGTIVSAISLITVAAMKRAGRC